MTSHRIISDTINTIRNRVRQNGQYITSEIRTKYTLIDPVLRALGWDTADPYRVQMECRFEQTNLIPDYLLFKAGKPAGILEAKALDTEQMPRLELNTAWDDQQVKNNFQKLQRGENIPETKLNPFNKSTWTSLKQANERQLEKYIQEIGLTSGYAILTNGDKWWVYDIAKYNAIEQTEPLWNAIAGETSLLLDDPRRTMETLSLLRYDRSWPQ